MKPRTIVTALLLVFVAASVVFLLLKETGLQSEPETAAIHAAGNDAEHLVIAYYFHTTARCPTCIRIESYTKATIETVFADRLEAGALRFLSLNVEDPENQHFIDDYDLTTKSVVLVDYRGGEQVRWKNLDRVWEFAGDRGRFVRYIENETRGFLGESVHD